MIGRILLALLCLAFEAASQDQIKVAFRDPSRPGSVRVSLNRGNITVKGYDGKEVSVETTAHKEDAKPDPEASGMRRVFEGRSGLTVEEENNAMKVSVASSRRVDILLHVPFKTSLKLTSIHGSSIAVENVEGDIEANSLHGSVTLTGVAGSVVAHALHGKVKATLSRVDPSKPMSFSSLHGGIDVTLPPGTKADLKMRTDKGEVYSDFDVTLGAPEAKVEEGNKEGRGKYRVTFGSNVTGRINGGGPEISFKTMHGNIYIRKGK